MHTVIVHRIEYCTSYVHNDIFIHINSVKQQIFTSTLNKNLKSKIWSLNMCGGIIKYKACPTECGNPLRAEDWSHNKLLTWTKLLFVQLTFFLFFSCKSLFKKCLFIYLELHQYLATTTPGLPSLLFWLRCAVTHCRDVGACLETR